MTQIVFEDSVFTGLYLNRWNTEITKPLLEWNRALLEARLDQAQIDALFGDVEQQMAGEKTSMGKTIDAGKKIAHHAGKLLPANITMKIHDMVKDSQPVRNFDRKFDILILKLLTKYPKFEKTFNTIGRLAKDRPILSAAAIGVLTTAAALAAGGAGGLAVGAFLKTSIEIMKGETTSKSLAKGIGVGLQGALAAMPIRALGDWLSSVDITSDTVSGHNSLLKVQLMHQTNGTFDLNVKTYMTRDMYEKVSTMMDNAATASQQGDYSQARQIYRELSHTFNDPAYVAKIENMLLNNEDLKDAAVASAKKTSSIFNTFAAAVQGAVTGTTSKKLDEADIKGIASSITQWAKDKAATSGKEISQVITVKKLVAAWDKAGRPTDSDAIHNILKSAGVPDSVLQQSFTSNNIPLPKKPSKPRSPRQPKISTGDAAFDKQINDMIKEKGRDATVQYLQDLKKQSQSKPAAASSNDTDEVIKINGVVIKPDDPNYAKLKAAAAKANVPAA